MSNPLISVVMSAYNAEKYLKRAIRSILNQSYEHFEFIIINDGSTDKTRQIIKEFTDDRIVFIDNKQNAGFVPARNDGLNISKGKYIAIMDADDESLPKRFELQLDFMERNQDIDVLGAAAFLVVNDKKKSYRKRVIKKPILHGYCLNMLITDVCCVHPTIMIRKTAINNVRYNKTYLNAEDYKLWIDLVKNGKRFANLDMPLLNYHWHGSNISITKKDEQAKYTKMAQKEYIAYFLGNGTTFYREELELLFNTNKTASLKVLSQCYSVIDPSKKQPMLRFFRMYIRENIYSIEYKFSRAINIVLLLYYLKYKVKNWLR